MKAMRCLILEDEPLAAEILAGYIDQVDFLDLVDTVPTAMDAMNVLKQQPIDVLFLDLHLPGIKGFDFLASLDGPPQVIVTTAYSDYALQGYSLNVIDYLMKPINQAQFLRAVNKLSPTKKTNEYLLLQRDKKQVPLPLDQIIWVESLKDYTTVHLTDGEHYTFKRTLQSIQDELSKEHFLRIHRSFLIRIDRITGFNQSNIQMADREFPIGRTYRSEVDAVLRRRFF